MPSTIPQTLLSPAELAYLHSSLSAQPQPIRPDLRSPTQFRPLTAETDVLPGANGSARVCYADGGEAVVGVKAEVVKGDGGGDYGTPVQQGDVEGRTGEGESMEVDEEGVGEVPRSEGDEGDNTRDPTLRAASRKNRRSRHANRTEQHADAASRQPRIDVTIDIPNQRDDDPLPSLLTSILTESLLASSSSNASTTSSPSLTSRLRISSTHHFHLHIDILLLSPPQSYPLPLLSLTLHLALLSTRLPRNVATNVEEDDPVWDDDWEAAVPLYPTSQALTQHPRGAGSKADTFGNIRDEGKPPITLLAITCGANVLFDPSAPELAVADSVLAISLAVPPPSSSHPHRNSNNREEQTEPNQPLRLISLRTISPPSRLTPLPSSGPGDILAEGATSLQGSAENGNAEVERNEAAAGTWVPKRGGVGRKVLGKAVDMAVRPDGVGWDVIRGVGGFIGGGDDVFVD
ncbi:MAG: hypothetical protein M1831_002977 [Alyxoria varia]|nr:MAG: hypothetical protein M1831_002977 [Alyxoria varia]